MEQEQSDIDGFFKQRLEDYKRKPRPMAWERIQHQLDTSSPRPKTYKMMVTYFAVAASVCLLLGIAYLFMTKQEDARPSLVLEQKNQDTVAYAIPHKKQEVKEEPAPPQTKKSTNLVAGTSKAEEIAWTRVPVADKKAVVYLPDSSKVFVNRNTQLSYRSDFLASREVELLEGEAYFDVKKRNGQGFSVKSNLAKTEVLGTSFMIRSHKEDGKDEIYVISGKVAVSSLRSPQKKIILLPNEKGWVDKNDFVSYEKIAEENYAAWKEDRIVFQNTDLGEVVETLQEYYGVSMHITNAELLSCRFTGRFEKSSLHEVLQVLSSTFNLTFNDKEGVYTLAGKGCR